MSRADGVEFHGSGVGNLSNETQRSPFLLVDRRGSGGFSNYDGGIANHANSGVTSSSSYHHHQRNVESQATPNPPIYSPTSASPRSVLLWADLEPWMDEEYVKQVCTLMAWDPLSIKIPRPAPDLVTGQLANNAGYCVLTFPSQQHAASVLATISANPSITMPNSTKPFTLNWALNMSSGTSTQPASFTPSAATPAGPYPKEYSVFVGDLAPETSNSDLVAVFRNPVLGLRNDREPKFIRPFLSCKSAKIMLDPVTGVSRGYGFVRFTDEADQQRALIEMHGLYCLSRPMRISPATAKFKPTGPMLAHDLAQFQQYGHSSPPLDPISIPQAKSVTASIASNQPHRPRMPPPLHLQTLTSSSSSLGAVSTEGGSSPNLTAATSQENFAKLYDSNITKLSGNNSISGPFNQEPPRLPMDYNPTIGSAVAAAAAGRYLISEESWKHHSQARAILGNLIGPNGEQLTSTDPYNTTVFVGGLSPLIQEETLRTFFAPFGDIHYVKVPVGKHCGFVQFVRKADAERAIEKMQGFPIGGSRIRLSWGRSQYKAAQAAAQAAQAAAMQPQITSQSNLFNFAATMQQPSSSSASSENPSPGEGGGGQLTQEQAIQLLQKLSQQGYLDLPYGLPSSSSAASASSASNSVMMSTGGGNLYSNVAHHSSDGSMTSSTGNGNGTNHHQRSLERLFSPSPTTGLYSEDKLRAAHLSGREDLVGVGSYDGRFDLQNFASHQSHPHSSSSPVGSHSHQQHQHHHSGQLYQREISSSSSRQAAVPISFSPFSPDPNALFAITNSSEPQQRRESFTMEDLGMGMSDGGKFVLSTASARPLSTSTGMPRQGNYHQAGSGGLMPRSGAGTGSAGASPDNRTPMPAPISRPSSGQPLPQPLAASSSTTTTGMGTGIGFELHDLNGTLASLDLGDRDRERQVGKWGSVGAGGSVQG
ncbi:hypothetical protein D9757_010459 [Collybiopsis confluens]|uniref:RRM domain-containing protein n=1 Tax=Collybiopsis confluens TaxID=2823264 RepID=A0A8H5GRU1_9AGAR|nr:hypothetical protein D9757_010459 [Collybiopsis confluens]